jgi:hypothetical protein
MRVKTLNIENANIWRSRNELVGNISDYIHICRDVPADNSKLHNILRDSQLLTIS